MKCFYCKQEIHDEAKKCHFCNEFVDLNKTATDILKENFRLKPLSWFLWVVILIFFSIFAKFITGWNFLFIFISILLIILIAIAYKMKYDTLLTFLSLCLAAIGIKIGCK